MGFFQNLFGGGTNTELLGYLTQGAAIIDVRSASEYRSGHIKGSINIPLDQFKNNLKRLPAKHKPVVLCCASGMRSGVATGVLKRLGYAQAINGGGWYTVQKHLEQATGQQL